MSPLSYEMSRSGRNAAGVFDTLCQITREQRARSGFVVNTMERLALFNLYKAQIRVVEFRYLANRRNGVVVLEDTVLRLRHKYKTHFGQIKRKSGAMSMVRQPIGPTTHWSENPLVRRPIGPKTHWSEDPLVRKSVIGAKIIGPKKCAIGPTAHWSENVPLVRK